MADLYGLLIEDLFRGRSPRIPRPFNPDHFLWRAGEHGLHGLLHAAVARRADLPPALKDLEPRLKALTMAQEAVVRVRLQVAREVAAVFARLALPAVFVKGAAVVVLGYESPGLRPFSDLDLLVGAGAVGRAARALESLGFREDVTVAPSSMERRFLRSGGASPDVAVDLHWDFVERDGPQAAVQVPVSEVLGRVAEAGGIPVPSTEDCFLLAAANLVRSRLDRLVLLADFDRMARLRPSWEAIRERAGRWRLRTALWIALDRAATFIGAQVSARVLAEFEPPSWQRAALRRLLGGSMLWRRRKFKQQVWSKAFPLACADSWRDAGFSLRAWGGRILD